MLVSPVPKAQYHSSATPASVDLSLNLAHSTERSRLLMWLRSSPAAQIGQQVQEQARQWSRIAALNFSWSKRPVALRLGAGCENYCLTPYISRLRFARI
jgi:hypothetical protein